MSRVVEILNPVRTKLGEFKVVYDEMLNEISDLPNEYTDYLTSKKGKLIRPALTVLSAELFGKASLRTYRAGALVELLHNASLIHDDVIDRSEIRRGKPSFNAIFGKDRAILFGDYLIASIFETAIEYGEKEYFKVLNHTLKIMSEGEIIQLNNIANIDISEETYFRIILRKTSELIANACELGAISANRSFEDRLKLREFGIGIGIAFQIQDDLFDFSLDLNTGKTPNNDLKERKLTLPLIYALTQMNKSEKKLIKTFLSNAHADDEIIPEITEIVRARGGIEYSLDKANTYICKSLMVLDEFPPSYAKDVLRSLAEYIVNRGE